MWKKADRLIKRFTLLNYRKSILIPLSLFITSNIHAAGIADKVQMRDMNIVLICIVVVLACIIIFRERKIKDVKEQAYNSDQRFRKLYDTGQVGLIFTNLDGRVVHANKAFLSIIGYTVDDVRDGRVNWTSLTPPGYMQATRDAIKQMHEQGFCTAFEKEYIHKDGHKVNVMLGSSLLEKNDFAEAVTYVIDISYKKQAELREQELNNIIKKQREELYGILMNAPAMVAIRRGPGLKLEFSNKAATDFVKFSSSLGLSTKEIMEKLKVMADPGISDEVIKTGKPYTAKAFHIQLDREGTGTPIDVWLDLVLEPVYDYEGKVDGVAFFGFDVTELVKANQTIKESENRFRFLADAISHKIWTSGPDGKATYYSKGWYDYTGKTRFKELNTRIWEIIHPDDLDTARELWNRVVETGESLDIEQRFMNVNGEYLWHLTRVNAHKDADGKVIMWIGTSTNIHEQKMAQNAADLLLKKKDEFLGIASHELKTPITSMKASLQILERLPEDEFNPQKVRPFIGMANKQVKKLTEIVDDLLDVTKIQSGKMQLNISEYLFQDSVQDCITEIGQYTNGHQLIIEKNEPVKISADRTRIEQVVINLLSNAIKYSPGKNRVLINIEKSRHEMKMSVTDFGIGIPRDKQSFIFDRFFRVHESSQNFSGLGLGLYISSEIINRHGGTMGMESEEGKGSMFWFTLPTGS